jgi:hypothetical protein
MLAQPAQYGLYLQLMLGELAFRQSQAPGQTGQVPDQAGGLIGVQPEAPIGIVIVIPMEVSDCELGLTDAAKSMDDETPALLELSVERNEVILAVNEVRDLVWRKPRARIGW